MIMIIMAKCFLCARSVLSVKCMNEFTLHPALCVDISLSPFYKWGNGSFELLGNLAKVP